MAKPKSITYGDALKTTAPRAFSAMVKLVGSACNLDCVYCYYLGKSSVKGGSQRTMSDSTLEEYIRQYISANQVDTVSFCWHGGEPLLAGIEFFEKAIRLQKKYADGKKIENVIQTNGTLIDTDW